MTAIHDTAYPRFKTNLSERELLAAYTPLREEIALAVDVSQGITAKIGFLLLLKTFQNLGYFVQVAEIPLPIVRHVLKTLQTPEIPDSLANYDASGARKSHIKAIRRYMQVMKYNKDAHRHLVSVLEEAARTKDEPADLINIAVEELIRLRYQLPAFRTLRDLANNIRVRVYRQFYEQVLNKLDTATREAVDNLFVVDPQTGFTSWNQIREDAGKPNLTHFNDWIERYQWLASLTPDTSILSEIPDVKLKHFAAEAQTLDAARLDNVKKDPKKYTLSLALIASKTAQTLDDLTDMFIKRMLTIRTKSREAFDNYRQEEQQRADELIAALHRVALGFSNNETPEQQYTAIEEVIGDRVKTLLQASEDHLSYAKNTPQAFTLPSYKSYRATLFDFIQTVQLRSTDQDKSLEAAISFLIAHEKSRGEYLPVVGEETSDDKAPPLLDLSWVADVWWPLITGYANRNTFPRQVNRRLFEVCVFTHILWDLKAGDLAVEASDFYSNQEKRLIRWDEYPELLALYEEQSGFPATDDQAMVNRVRTELETIATQVDLGFPDNAQVRLEQGRPVVSRAPAKAQSAQATKLAAEIAARLEEVNILKVMFSIAHWLNLPRFFGPISGYDAKIDNPFVEYVITLFCYGCMLGPSQTARVLEGITLDRREIAWINRRHITEDALDLFNQELINAYNRFQLPKVWGSGRRASADGTKWDIYQDNLLAQYHIRYGGYGGIGYYHISDTYIALFSNFFVCGAYEGVYILDLLEKNQSAIQPDTIHSDTHGQSEPIFGLAYLLGIKLMPRIKDWKKLIFYRPSKMARYPHIDTLFTAIIDWDLIRSHLQDMLRVVLSIRAGRISPSAILRRLGTYSRKNRLYQAFAELGCAVRTIFLLQFLADQDLRVTITAALNKNEAFNKFIQWVGFGKGGVITENDRDEQRKIIKYNHVVANMLIFYNVAVLTRILNQLAQQGFLFTEEDVATISPYLSEHINRFGRYSVEFDVLLAQLDYTLPILFSSSGNARNPA